MDKLYLILDRDGSPVEQGVLESPPGTEMLQFRLVKDEDEAPDLTGLGEIQLVGLDDRAPSVRGEIVRQRGNRLAVRPKGQVSIQGHDLSCGGLAFHCAQPLKDREIVEAVLPVTDEPLVVRMRILRMLPTEDSVPLYAARFVDLCMDEEVFIRKAVFSIQVGGR